MTTTQARLCTEHHRLDCRVCGATSNEPGGEVGTGAGEGAPRQDTGSAWVTRSADCPEAPAQAHLHADNTTDQPEEAP